MHVTLIRQTHVVGKLSFFFQQQRNAFTIKKNENSEKKNGLRNENNEKHFTSTKLNSFSFNNIYI
jgi:hypothetical protein